MNSLHIPQSRSLSMVIDNVLNHSALALTTLAHKLAYRYERQRQRRQLAQLDDRLLSDIGITRAQAEEEARKGFSED